MKKDNTKNWLLVLPTDAVMGSEQIIMNYAKYLHQEGYHCTILILTKKRKKGWEHLEADMTITYLPFSSFGMGILGFIPYLLFKKTRHIAYTFSSQTIINGLLGFAKKIGFFKNAAVIVRESNSIFELLSGIKLKIYHFFYVTGYSKTSLVICQTSYMKNQLIKAIPRLSKKLQIQTIPNPVNFSEIQTKSKEVFPELEKRSFLVAAGRLVPAKGFDILIDTFHEISKENPHLELIILGHGKDKEELLQQRDMLGLTEKIQFPGYVTNVYPYFKSAKACVISSRIEGFPNVLLQMMSQNTKVVSTLSAGDIEEIPGIYTCPPLDNAQLKNAIVNCLQDDTDANRAIFDTYLKERTQEAFSNRIFNYLKINS